MTREQALVDAARDALLQMRLSLMAPSRLSSVAGASVFSNRVDTLSAALSQYEDKETDNG